MNEKNTKRKPLRIVIPIVICLVLGIGLFTLVGVGLRPHAHIGNIRNGSYYSWIFKYTPEKGKSIGIGFKVTLDLQGDNYAVGDDIYSYTIGDNGGTLLCNDEIFLPVGTIVDAAPKYYGDNLVFSYINDGDLASRQYVLITPTGEIRELPNANYVTGMDGFVLYLVERTDDKGHAVKDLYCYDVRHDQSSLIYVGADIYQAVTDGTWLFTVVPWNGGRTDCWRLVYDNDGRIIGIELVETNII